MNRTVTDMALITLMENSIYVLNLIGILNLKIRILIILIFYKVIMWYKGRYICL